MDAYLDEPPVPKAVIKAAGGLLKYWETQTSSRPDVRAMAIAYLTAPGKLSHSCHKEYPVTLPILSASSVDAERSFSQGKLATSDLQQNTCSNTFRAEMALGSWQGTPLLPSIDTLASML